MEKWRKWLIPGLLVLGLVAVGTWGFRESQARLQLQNRAESQYQRSFHELAEHVDEISGQLAQILVSSSKEQSTLGLATVWRQVFAAQANIGGLPLGLIPLSKTEKFLADTGSVSYGLLTRTTQGEAGFTENDLGVLEELYERAKALREDLNQLSAKILNQQLSWTQMEVAMNEGGKELEDNTIVNGFRVMEQKMEEYPEMNLGEDFTRVQPDTKVVRGQQEINFEKAETLAQQWWFTADTEQTGRLSYEGVGNIPTYGIEFPAADGEEPVYIDVSKLDGTVIWVMKPKTVGGQNLDLIEGEKYSRKFLKEHGLTNIALVKAEEEDNMGVYTYVPLQGEVLLYPDQVKVQVALDNGEVTGYEGTLYYMYHETRDLPTPALSASDIRNQVSSYLNIELIRPALIANIWGKEILTWEVRGTFGDEKFVIFYNANTGSEEEISRITPPPKYEFNTAG